MASSLTNRAVMSSKTSRKYPMPFMYQADLWCDSCGEAIRKRLTCQGKSPADLDDEYSFDSDVFPKLVVAGDRIAPNTVVRGKTALRPLYFLRVAGSARCCRMN